MKNISTFTGLLLFLLFTFNGYGQEGGGEVVVVNGGGDSSGACDPLLESESVLSLDVIGTSSSVIDLWGGTDDGWNNQIRFWDKCNGEEKPGELRHVIATHDTRGTLVIYPGFQGNGTDVVEVAGKMVIGTSTVPTELFNSEVVLNDYKFFVNGGILATEVRVATGWADYVFFDDYQLLPLAEVKEFITENDHLPNMPPATEIEEEGLPLGELTVKQQEKIEELFLYLIEMEERLEKLEVENKALRIQLLEVKKE